MLPERRTLYLFTSLRFGCRYCSLLASFFLWSIHSWPFLFHSFLLDDIAFQNIHVLITYFPVNDSDNITPFITVTACIWKLNSSPTCRPKFLSVYTRFSIFFLFLEKQFYSSIYRTFFIFITNVWICNNACITLIYSIDIIANTNRSSVSEFPRKILFY